MRTVAGGIALTGLLVAASCGGSVSHDRSLMSAEDALALPRPPADIVAAYGSHPLQFGELRLPAGEGPHPVAIVIHGGCWLAEYDLGYMSGLAAALARNGVATWSIEYRRIGDEGGGWPGTFTDVAAAADALRGMAAVHGLDPERVVAVGHSAGGHLALWLAGRARLAPDDPLRGDAPQPLIGVVSIAGIPDLAAYVTSEGCGAAVPDLLGGDPSAVPERVGRTSPIAMLPAGVTQVLVTGELDTIVPATQAEEYVETARLKGDHPKVSEVSGAGHFELVDPSHTAFATVRAAVLEMVSPVGEP